MHRFTRTILVVTLPMLLFFAQSAPAAETLNADQVRALFSGKTIEYQHERLGFKFVVYHAPDGSLRGTREGQLMSELQWSVNEQGELCIAYGGKNRCQPIMKDNGVYKKYTVGKDGQKKTVVTYQRFIEGNPNNF
ncbi:hypothetical protein [Thiohalophilus sp.]|uniref:hypothetical protein n=1 Tax=Thiohalophilus sp. TaxID=3028392 RepID=UPI002ACF026C|nr:hypothetical protein [Thiohalophilus sp.]MDZ7661680.1 hypothetical protein [Thiohalophilus sp.]